MPRQPKLTDLQLILLSHAAAGDDRSVMPLPGTATDRQRADRELKALLKRGLLAETDTSDRKQSWRSDGDLYFALTITEAGLTAIGLGERDEDADSSDAGVTGVDPSGQGWAESAANPAAAPSSPPRSTSKIARVLDLLRRGEGATLAELVAATGWQPHTTRAALTGLRKKGHVVSKAARDGVTCYRITDAA